MFRRCSNTGKWGPNDELGTLNYITPAKRVAAARPREDGRGRVGRTRSVDAAVEDQRPAGRPHDVFSADGPSAGDSFTIAPHGMVVTHMDALVHFSWKDQFYNGRKRRRR